MFSICKLYVMFILIWLIIQSSYTLQWKYILSRVAVCNMSKLFFFFIIKKTTNELVKISSKINCYIYIFFNRKQDLESQDRSGNEDSGDMTEEEEEEEVGDDCWSIF